MSSANFAQRFAAAWPRVTQATAEASGYGSARAGYSGLTPASLTTFAHLAISAFR